MNRKILVLIILCIGALQAGAQLRLPKLVSDGMVLQQNTELKIWGWASPKDVVAVEFLNKQYTSVTDAEGNWILRLPELNAGGPFKMTVSTEDTSIVINDILIGEVWLCSGQSNMQFVMQKVKKKYAADIAIAKNENIRSFEVPKKYDFSGVQNDLKNGKWLSANPQSVLNYSAVAYFFGLELYNKYKVPIGLINASVGGTPAQAWMSEEALKIFPHYYDEAQKCKDISYLKSITQKNEEDAISWNVSALRLDKGIKDGQTPWYANDIECDNWPLIEMPGYWNKTRLVNTKGIVWLRRKLKLSKVFVNNDVKLKLGRIVNADSVYINGTKVGSTDHQYAIRNYTVPRGILKEGENNITIRVVNNRQQGGIVKGNKIVLVTEDETLDLSGKWHYQLGAKMPALERPVMLQWKSTGLYNNMIAPLRKYALKGVIWYQGEGNTRAAKEYAHLFPALINDWRTQWDNDDLPFLFVQLANFMKVEDQPKPSAWAMLRDSQLKTLALKNTGMAVAIDIGEWNDIHPLNKKDVGKRLALAAQKFAYHEELVHSGPIYKSMKIKKDKIILSFQLNGSSLQCSNGKKLEEFAIAGADKKFVWAKAKIKGDKLIVWSDEVDNPVAVRYAWANNPDKAKLVNKEGLPASPFRTDDWEK